MKAASDPGGFFLPVPPASQNKTLIGLVHKKGDSHA
jgi:hypothetical protein